MQASWRHFVRLPFWSFTSWQSASKRWRGVYYLHDQSIGTFILWKRYIFLYLLFSLTVLLEMDRIQLWAGPTCIIHKQASCCFTFSKRQKMACQIKNIKLNLIVFIRLVLLKRNTQGRSCVGSVSRCLKRNILYRWADFSRQCIKWIPRFFSCECWYQA